MAEPVNTDEEGLRRIIASVLREEGMVRNDVPRRRRHVTLLGGGSSEVVMFRLEERLCVGDSAYARIMDEATFLTKEGERIVVIDNERKWFGRGDPAPLGDSGGDGRLSGGYSNVGWAKKIRGSDEVTPGCDQHADTFTGVEAYSILSMGTWYRWIEGHLSEDQETHPWRAWLDDEDFDAWDGDLGSSNELETEFVDATGDVEGRRYVTLLGVCIEPADGMFFIAVYNERLKRYRVVTLCCEPEE